MAGYPNNKNTNGQEDEPVSFSVMPRGDTGGLVTHPTPAGDANRPMADIVRTPTEHPGIWHNKYTYILLGLLVLVALGAIAYFMVGSGGSGDDKQPASRLPAAFLQQYFGSPECQVATECSDTADPDNDGLENWDELTEQTNPKDNDTDNDGLADGDEVHVFLTNPINEYTDPRAVAKDSGYTDGSQIKNDYDPLTPGLKMVEARKGQIASDTAKHSLHEPTKTTLAEPVVPPPIKMTVFISNGKFDPPGITIRVNDSITWINRDSASHQIASDPHPSHTGLPGLESGSLATNQTFTYTFTQAGSFGYHDHLNPTITGSVTVQ